MVCRLIFYLLPPDTMRLIFTCKQASHQLSKVDYEKLPPLQKLSLKFHVFICPVCGSYNRQVMKFQDMVRSFRERKEKELEAEAPDAPRLPDTSREQLKAALEKAKAEVAPGE